MIKRKFKKCKSCGRFCPIWSRGRCKYCATKEDKKPKKPRKPINKVSKKRTTDLNKYGKVRAEYLKEHPCCEVGLPGCAGCDSRLLQIHHRKGRIGDLLTNKEFFLAVCYDCHMFIERNPEEAYKNGWSLSRLENG